MKIIDRINEYLEEKESPRERAEMRLDSFESKCGGDEGKLKRMINTRTTRTTKREKLVSWAQLLKSRGYKDEAKNAEQKLRSL